MGNKNNDKENAHRNATSDNSHVGDKKGKEKKKKDHADCENNTVSFQLKPPQKIGNM